MRTSLSLGRIAGIRIGINWSVLVLLALLVWTLATSIFPDQNEDIDSEAVYLSMAVAAAVLFFSSILLHELGHAVQARRDGLGIDGITLWLFGGVARFTGGFPSAGAEFRIAVAGPLVSLALGGGFLGVAFVPGLPEPVGAVAAWLGFINLLLLVFNLLPALPLDGGRMLRAGLWRWKGDFAAATRTAARAARVISLLVIGAGAAMLLLAERPIGGLWLIFIGWFLLQAAAAEGRAAVASSSVGDLRVRDAMVRDPVTTRPDATLAAFVEESVWGTRYAAYPVVDDGRAVGLMMVRRLSELPQEEWDRRRVSDLMAHRGAVPALAPDDELIDAHNTIVRSGLGRGLVLDQGRLVGMLSTADVRRALELRGFGIAPAGRAPSNP